MRCNGQRAYTLLELLLSLMVIAVILIMTVDHYLTTQRNADVVSVKTDIQILKRALDSYYQQTGCYQNGTFSKMPSGAKEFDPDIVNDLKLSASYQSHLPLVTQYSVAIIDTNTKTAAKKPLYRFKIKAQLADNVSVDWYAKQLAAQGSENQNELYWQSLPDMSYVEPNKAIWILDATRKVFREQQNKPNDPSNASVSGSFCAN